MKVKLVFDWRKIGEADSIYSTELGIALSSGDLHSGTVFDAELILDKETEMDIRLAFQTGAYPVFSVVME